MLAFLKPQRDEVACLVKDVRPIQQHSYLLTWSGRDFKRPLGHGMKCLRTCKFVVDDGGSVLYIFLNLLEPRGTEHLP